MTDKTELKRLADAATQGEWTHFKHGVIKGGPAVKFANGSSQCQIAMTVGADWMREGEQGANADFIATANPVAIKALIAENERVKSRLCVCRDCGGHGEIYSGQSTYQGHNQPPEPDMDVCGTCGGDGALGTVEDFEALAAERDQLKTENDALRKDADRYRWLRGQYWNESEIAVVCHPKKAVKLGFDCPSEERLDCAIDAAMGKGEQS